MVKTIWTINAALFTILAIGLMVSPERFIPSAPPVQVEYVTEAEYQGKILIPTGANPETTPTVLVDGYWIPEESPIGTYPITAWLDNSPVYGGGWYLQVNDTTHTIEWRTMTEEQWDMTTVTPSGL